MEGFERRGDENNVANAFQVARRTKDGELVSVDEHGLSVGSSGEAFYDTEAEAEEARQQFMQAREVKSSWSLIPTMTLGIN
ncbi:hypothetical protein [Treponema sp.]|uniref:hypothetical protein n=1 Tax=Treponema sp. TaxID=166 RepID=UPI003F108DD2